MLSAPSAAASAEAASAEAAAGVTAAAKAAETAAGGMASSPAEAAKAASAGTAPVIVIPPGAPVGVVPVAMRSREQIPKHIRRDTHAVGDVVRAVAPPVVAEQPVDEDQNDHDQRPVGAEPVPQAVMVEIACIWEASVMSSVAAVSADVTP